MIPDAPNAGHYLLAWSASGMPVRCMPVFGMDAAKTQKIDQSEPSFDSYSVASIMG
jgi:hypothetical protein